MKQEVGRSKGRYLLAKAGKVLAGIALVAVTLILLAGSGGRRLKEAFSMQTGGALAGATSPSGEPLDFANTEATFPGSQTNSIFDNETKQ